MKVFITGVNGFLGHYIAEEFLGAGCTVTGIDCAATKHAHLGEKLAYRSMHLPDVAIDELLGAFSPEVCVHCAGSASVAASISDPAADFNSSVVVTERLIAALRKAAPRCRSIFLSSAAVYGQPDRQPVREEDLIKPLSPYGYHKKICEMLFEQAALINGLPTASLRIFSAYGPGLKRQVLWEIAAQLADSKLLQLKGTGHETRDFIHAADVARAVRTIVEKAPAKGEVYNVAAGVETSIREAAELLCTHFPGAEPPRFAGQRILGDPQRWRADCSRLADLGFSANTCLEEGLASLAQWTKEQRAPQS